MTDVALMAVILVAVATATVVGLLVRSGRRPGLRAATAPPAVVTLLRGARRRALSAVGVTVTASGALFMAGFAVPELLGLPVLLAAPLASGAGMVLYAATPPSSYPVGPEEVRTASLTPRGPLTYVSARAGIAPLAALLVLVVFVAFAGITSSADDSGLSRAITFSSDDRAASASPYAGWFYGVPLLLACVLLTVATLAALWRVSATPALPAGSLDGIDAAWRRGTIGVLSAIGVFAVCLPLGGAAAVSGAAILRAAHDGVDGGWIGIGIGLVAGGVLSLVVAVLSASSAMHGAFALPALGTSAVRPEAAAPAGRPPVER